MKTAFDRPRSGEACIGRADPRQVCLGCTHPKPASSAVNWPDSAGNWSDVGRLSPSELQLPRLVVYHPPKVGSLSPYLLWPYLYLRAGGVPTRHTHTWDGLHTRHLLESTHTNTHKHTVRYSYSVAVGRDTNRHVQPTVSSCRCCFNQELLLLVEASGDICVQNHRGLPIVSLDLALLLQAVDGLHPNALPLG